MGKKVVTETRSRVISILRLVNPKQENSIARAVYALYREGMTVADYLRAGGSMRAVDWDIDHHYIEVFDAGSTEANAVIEAQGGADVVAADVAEVCGDPAPDAIAVAEADAVNAEAEADARADAEEFDN